MKNFRSIEVADLNDSSTYKQIEEGIYGYVGDESGSKGYKMPVAMELEEGEDSQYPLEDILDKYLIQVEDFLESNNPRTLRYVLGGDLYSLQEVKSLFGKRIYNQDYEDESGQTSVRLVIE